MRPNGASRVTSAGMSPMRHVARSTLLLLLSVTLACSEEVHSFTYKSLTRYEVAPVKVGSAHRVASATSQDNRRVRRKASQSSSTETTSTSDAYYGKVPASTLSNAPSSFTSFEGLGFKDNVRFGVGGHPPDGGIARSDKYIVEAINSIVAVYNTAGTKLAEINFMSIVPWLKSGLPKVPAAASEKEGDQVDAEAEQEREEHKEEMAALRDGQAKFSNDSMTDPRLIYDEQYDRFLAVYMLVYGDGNVAANMFFVTNSSDPTKNWTAITTDSLGSYPNGTWVKDITRRYSCPCLSDQPGLGVDKYSITITSNMFDINGNTVDVIAWVFPKDPIFRGVLSGWKYIMINEFRSPYQSNVQLFGIQPSTVQPGSVPYPDTRGVTFLVTQSPPYNYGEPDSMLVMAITGTRTLYNISSVSISNWIQVRYKFKLPNPRFSMRNVLGIGGYSCDNRFASQVSFAGGRLFAVTGFSAVPVDQTGTVDGVQVMIMKPAFSGWGDLTVTLVKNVYYAVPGYDLEYPAVAADPYGNGVASFQLWSKVKPLSPTGKTKYYMGAGFAAFNAKGYTSPVYAARTPKMQDYNGVSFAPRSNLTGYMRLGDYSNAQYHPKTKSVVFMSQYAGSTIYNVTYNSTFYYADQVPRPVNVLDNTVTVIGIVNLASVLGSNYCATAC